jgi:hypothetical protein
LTWWIFEPTDQLAVTCSQGHRSTVPHHVHEDGTLHAPDGQAGSMHCGKCNEELPLRLADWPLGETWAGPRVEKLPPLTTCARCGKQSHFLGGWGMCNGYASVICPGCFSAVVFEGEK